MYKYHTNLSHLSPASSFFNVFDVLLYAAHSSFGHVVYLFIACGAWRALSRFLDRQYSACWWSVEYVQWVGRGLLGLFFFKAETFMALSMKEIN